MKTTVEREIKLRFNSPDEARMALLTIGAKLVRSRRLQEDRLLDSPDGSLRRQQSLLRVRMEANKSHLTYKGPAQLSTMKVREEIETSIGNGTVLLKLLEKLGFTVWFRYQKYREEFWYQNVIVAIDETPVGTFVEIEGDEKGITRTAQALGKPPVEYILDSYRGLFLKYRDEHCLNRSNMVFDKEP